MHLRSLSTTFVVGARLDEWILRGHSFAILSTSDPPIDYRSRMENSKSVAVVTGASRGIGRRTAQVIAGQMDHVVIVARGAADLEQVSAEIGPKAVPVEADVATDVGVRAVTDLVRDRFGGCDLLVNNAAAMVSGNIADYSTEDLDRLLATNIRGPFLLMRDLLPMMLGRERPTVVNVASLAPTVPNPGLGAYAATKAALITLTEAFREEVREDGVRVSVILPGSTRTSLFGREITEDDRWMLDPDDVATAIAHIYDASPGAVPSRIDVRPLRRRTRTHPPRR